MILMGTRVDPTTYLQAVELILDVAMRNESCVVYAANVHMLMESYDSPAFKAVVNSADLVTPDGMPLVWILRLKGQKDQQRVYGPTLMLYVLEAAAREKVPVGFYGGMPEVLQALTARVQVKFPDLKIVYSFSSPFREMSREEDKQVIEDINNSGTRILFVGLGCPKQEKWMAEHRGKINAVMLGVGAAFDFHAGVKPQAPAWMQKAGLEWLHRLATEPRRLWRRYLYHNPRFVFLAILDMAGMLRR
ncbi:MAG: WecB/TagA/CpsF family glycosyltransferase [Chloroflexi bacterium]|nr:WecB/TagA/CpsF family glycosyltransferase [Chloroflexota bacterium]